jgi:hypothetical protein
MKQKYSMYFLSMIFSLLTLKLIAQTPTDAIMMSKGDICWGLFYEHGAWDEYWEGERLLSNGNVGTLTRTTVLPMFAYGLLNRVNLLAGLPYVKTSSDGGQLTGVQGFQDLSIGLKANFLERQTGPGTVYFLTTGEFSTPVSNYLSDYAPYSLGLHTDQFTLRGILQYKFDMGLYFRGSAAHLWRTYSKVERDFYYNNGSYYTEWMDVPNAWNFQGTAGIWLLNDNLQIESNYTYLSCIDGDDIRAWNPGQPTNKVEVTQVGGHVRYYLSKPAGLGVIASYAAIIDGRNMGKFSNISVGVTYQFKLF